MSSKEKKPAEKSRRQPLTPEEESIVGGGIASPEELLEALKTSNQGNDKVTVNTTISLF